MSGKEKKSKELPPPSEEFELAFRDAGSGSIECGFCGRMHFVSDSSEFDWEEGEYEKLEAGERKNPDRYISHVESSVEWGHLDGKQYVLGCPCNVASRYERFIVSHRRSIVSFLKARAKKLSRESQSESALVEEL